MNHGSVGVQPPRIGWTAAEVATALGISQRHVYALVAQGELKGRRIGRRLTILNTDLEEFVAALPSAS